MIAGSLEVRSSGTNPRHDGDDMNVTGSFSAVIQPDGAFWIGWIEEIPGVNSEGETKEELLENLHSALEEILEMNRKEALAAARDEFEEVRIQL